MPQKFFENTLQSKFIKNLVRNFNIPMIPTVADGDFLIDGCLYIYGTSIIKCTKTGTLDNKRQYVKSICSNFLKVAKTGIYVSDLNISTADYTEIDYFKLGLEYSNLTETYVSRTSFYDPDTHYYLGNILRAIRDIYSIDLMPFYNCFSARTADINILNGTKVVDELGNIKFKAPFCEMGLKSKYRTYIIPIKFNKTYTIAIDSPVEVRMCPVIYKDGALVKDDDGTVYSDRINCKPKILGNMNFRMPTTFKVKNRDYKLQTLEKDLYLAIQLDASIKTSVVVLEGDYTHSSYKVYNHAYSSELTEADKNRLFLSPLSLLQISDGNSYAFSDRLIEYLLLNVVTNQDEISDNIRRVQKYISDDTKKTNYIQVNRYSFMPYKGKVTGIWDDNLRAALYDIYMHNGSNKLDINGFVDRDVEKLITRGFDV